MREIETEKVYKSVRHVLDEISGFFPPTDGKSIFWAISGSLSFCLYPNITSIDIRGGWDLSVKRTIPISEQDRENLEEILGKWVSGREEIIRKEFDKYNSATKTKDGFEWKNKWGNTSYTSSFPKLGILSDIDVCLYAKEGHYPGKKIEHYNGCWEDNIPLTRIFFKKNYPVEAEKNSVIGYLGESNFEELNPELRVFRTQNPQGSLIGMNALYFLGNTAYAIPSWNAERRGVSLDRLERHLAKEYTSPEFIFMECGEKQDNSVWKIELDDGTEMYITPPTTILEEKATFGKDKCIPDVRFLTEALRIFL